MIDSEIFPHEISVGFVCYKPTEQLLTRLKLLQSKKFKTYIFDNSPDTDFVRSFCKQSNYFSYTTCGRNVGLGVSLDAICSQAFYDGFSFMLFFDQDTLFNETTLAFIEQFSVSKQQQLAEYSSVVFNAKKYEEGMPAKYEMTDVLLSINSGSLFVLKNLKKLNWHNPTFFVDSVDYELCLRSDNLKLKIGECSYTPGFDHVTEQADKKHKIFGKEWMLRRYPINRIIDNTWANARIFLSALKTLNFKFAYNIGRSICIYFYFQILSRISKPSNE